MGLCTWLLAKADSTVHMSYPFCSKIIYYTKWNISGVYMISCYISLHKKFFRSQAQRAGNRQILEARKKLHKPELFCQFMGSLQNLIWFIYQRRLLQWHPFVSLIKRICIYLPLFTFKERNSGLFCPIFLSVLSTILQAQSGLRSWNFTCPVWILQVSDIGLVLSFEDCYMNNI